MPLSDKDMLPFSVLPEVTAENRFFWVSGGDSTLRIQRCGACGYYNHPPYPRCRRCQSIDVMPVEVSGRGVVHSFTVNHHAWFKDAKPYVFALVELDEQEGLRLTSNIIGCDPDEVSIDMPVEVVFRRLADEAGEVWLPLFKPAADGTPRRAEELAVESANTSVDRPKGRAFVRPHSDRFEQRVCISGVGQSAVGRRLAQSELALTLDACLEAIADAGLTCADIDGLATFPGAVNRPPRGFAGPDCSVVQDALGLQLDWRLSSFDGAAQLQAVVNACMAVASGLATHVLVYRTVTEAQGQGSGSRATAMSPSSVTRVEGTTARFVPFGAVSPANWLGPLAHRHFHVYGTTREQLGWIPITERANARLNPKALLRDPMTMDDYLAARMISTPFGLFDCDIPADASTALVVSRREYAPDAPNKAVFIDAVGTAARGRAGVAWDLYEDMTSMPAEGAAAHMWSRTGLRPSDVDVACLYDGFSILALVWIEALGLAPKGEGGAFVEGGKRIAREGGEFALNPNGGQLSAGRLHGYGYIHEAIVQLRGDAGQRQVPDDPQVAVISNGGGHLAGCLLLTREPH